MKAPDAATRVLDTGSVVVTGLPVVVDDPPPAAVVEVAGAAEEVVVD
jgi:hypothetical protein